MLFQRIRGRAIAVFGVVALLVAGCSSGGGGGSSTTRLSPTDPLATVATAMTTAKSGRVSGSIDTESRSNAAPLSGTWQGDLGGELDANVTFIAGSGTHLPTELRVVRNAMYYTRTVAVIPNDPTLSVFTRSAEFKPWRTARLGGIVNAIPSAFSPGALVQWLRTLQVPVKTGAGDKIGGAKTTLITTARAVTVGIWQSATVELSVDDKARVVRVKISSGSGGAHYDVTDFGTSVNVTPPPTDQIETRSEIRTPEPAGPFVTATSGASDGVLWALQSAPGSVAGTQCWRWQAAPALPQAGLKRPTDPRCVTLPAKDADPEDTVTFVVEGDGTGSYNALAILLPVGAKDLTLGFVGGKMQPLAATGNLAVWIGPNDPAPGYLGVTLADGTKLDCGAGAVSVPADLNDPSATARIAGAPWGCLQHTS